MERTKGSGFDEEGPGNVQVGIPLYLGSVIYFINEGEFTTRH